MSRREDVVELERLERELKRSAVERGLQVLRSGQVAYGILAAGASSRMNLAAMPPHAKHLLERAGRTEILSKALVPVAEIDGRVWSFLDLFLENVARFSSQTRSACPVLLLASHANAEEIERHLESTSYVPAERLLTFHQSLDRQIIATEADVERARKNFASELELASALEISRRFAGHDLEARKPAGHGEFLHQLVSSGTLGRLLDRGVRWVSVRNIDNVGAVFDADWLAILGRLVASAKNFVVEVSRRPGGPAGKGGALVVRPSGDFQLAEDPALAGTGCDPRDSYYINDAVAIFSVEYLFRIYETSESEIARASLEERAAIAERGRRRFPPLIDVKPVRLANGVAVGAFVCETNLWESTGVEPGLGVDAIGVLSVKDVEEGYEALEPREQQQRAVRVRFVATKKWEDYEGLNAQLVPHIARRIVTGDLLAD